MKPPREPIAVTPTESGEGSDPRIATAPATARERVPVARLPHGVRDYLPEAAARRHAMAEALVDEFARWGYRRIITPSFEYEAVLARGLGRGARREAVRFVEPSTGEVVALRPDITPQVARLVATRLAGEPGPIRLAYEGAVVRLGAGGGQRELFQAGVELVDAPSPTGDVEVLALAGAALQATGLARWTLDLSEVSVARAALDGLAPDDAAPLERAIARKDVDEVARRAKALAVPARQAKLLAALPSLYGGVEVIAKARKLVDGTARAGLDTLAAVVDALVAIDETWRERLSIDLGEVRGFDYYTGIRFHGFAPGSGVAVLSGGRYDRLIERYGRSARAAGFAVDVEAVAAALEASGGVARSPSRGVLVAGDAVAAARLCAQLRALGVTAVQELDPALSDGNALRSRAAHRGLARAILVDKRTARWWLAMESAVGRIDLRALAAGDAAAVAEVRKWS